MKEHETVLDEADELQTLVHDTSDVALVRERIETFAQHLQSHFAREERGGYYADAVEQRPELERRADALSSQHTQLRDQLDELSHARPSSWERRVDSLVDLLRAHEHAERELIQDAYMQDIGVGD